MKNILVINSDGEQLVSSTHDTTNRLLINDNEIDSSLWVGNGNYIDTIEGHEITIAKAPDLDGDYQLVKTSDYNYEFRDITGGSTGNYENLTNKPQINSVELIGNKSINDLGLVDFFYPVGSYYETSDSDFDPNVSWGGTWEKDSAGRVTVAQDTADASFDTIGETGGVKDAVVPYHRHSVDSVNISSSGEHTHTITALHYKANAKDRQFTSGGNWKQETFNTGGTGNHTHSVPSHNTNYEGTSGNATNANLQPYIVVVRWHRTA